MWDADKIRKELESRLTEDLVVTEISTLQRFDTLELRVVARHIPNDRDLEVSFEHSEMELRTYSDRDSEVGIARHAAHYLKCLAPPKGCVLATDLVEGSVCCYTTEYPGPMSLYIALDDRGYFVEYPVDNGHEHTRLKFVPDPYLTGTEYHEAVGEFHVECVSQMRMAFDDQVEKAVEVILTDSFFRFR